MLSMVIERFRNGDAAPIYRRFHERGRLLPEGLHYLNSWTETNFDRCFQLMECDDEKVFADWIANWSDLADFEVVPVAASEEVQQMFSRRA